MEEHPDAKRRERIRKVAEESIEHEVCGEVTPTEAIMHGLADVVLAAAVVAHHHEFTVEEAIRAKCELDFEPRSTTFRKAVSNPPPMRSICGGITHVCTTSSEASRMHSC